METYFLFAGYYYYPSGGMSDLREVFEAENDDEALAKVGELLTDSNDWWQLASGGERGLHLVETGDRSDD